MKLIAKAVVVLAVASASGFAQDLSKLTFEGGIGPSLPVATTKDRLNTGFGVLLGGGYRFTNYVSTLLEFQYDRFNLNDNALAQAQQLAGYNRFWSLTINPRLDTNPQGRFNVYGTGGYGLYSRSLVFTDPTQVIGGYCDPYYGYCQPGSSAIVAEFTNYRGGFNVGGGAEYNLGGSGLKVFIDARYNRFLAHHSNEFVTLTFGIHY